MTAASDTSILLIGGAPEANVLIEQASCSQVPGSLYVCVTVLQEASLRLQWASRRGALGSGNLLFTNIPPDHLGSAGLATNAPDLTAADGLAASCCASSGDTPTQCGKVSSSAT